MKNCDKNKELSNLKYWDVNNLYRWEMSQMTLNRLKIFLNLMKIS